LADDLDETLAGVDLVAEDLAEVTRISTEVFLNEGIGEQRGRKVA
jgi:hypothetical protein